MNMLVGYSMINEDSYMKIDQTLCYNQGNNRLLI